MGLIYMRTSPSGKSYIGLTTQTEQQRWIQHCQGAYNVNSSQYFSKLGRAIRKYGISNFTVKILETCLDSQLPKREIYWIQYYNTYYNGYNETLGGEGYWKYHTEDMIEMWNQGLNKKEIAQIIGCDEKTVRNHLKSIISKNQGYLQGQKKICPSQDKINLMIALWQQGYNIQEIQSLTSISCPTISKHLKRNGVSSDEIIQRRNIQSKSKRNKPVVLYNINEEIIEEYNSLRAASIKLNMNIVTLKNIIKGTSRKYKNIILKFKE